MVVGAGMTGKGVNGGVDCGHKVHRKSEHCTMHVSVNALHALQSLHAKAPDYVPDHTILSASCMHHVVCSSMDIDLQTFGDWQYGAHSNSCTRFIICGVQPP